jgi:hypothetical protein
MSLNGVVASPTVQVYITLGFNDLPPDQQSQVTSLLARALHTQQDLAVPTGSYIATSFHTPTTITSQLASAPLSGRGIVDLVGDEGQGTGWPCAGLLCVQFIGPGNAPPPGGQQWSIQAQVALHWSFSDSTGRLVSNVVFQGDNSAEFVGKTISLFLSFNRTQGWTIAQNDAALAMSSWLQDTFCSTGQTILQQMIETSGGGYSDNVLHNQQARGCEIQAYVYNSYQGAFLWRFGVLLAVDKQAHTTAPQLPIAPQAEISALSA